MFLLLFSILTIFSAYGHSDEYLQIHEQLASISINPTEILQKVENAVMTGKDSLSTEKREDLIKQLEEIKKNYKKPRPGLLLLLLMVTAWCGFKSYMDYQSFKALHKAPSLLESLVGINSGHPYHKFMDNFYMLIISLLATVAFELEYRESVHDLLKKEYGLERKITKIINMLKAN